MPNVMNMEGLEWGMRDHSIRARNNPRVGAIKKGYIFAEEGRVSSLVNSFRASAIGWGSPIIPTLLGPLRVWK